MRPWIERLPERLAFELAEFERLAPDFAADEVELAGNQRLVMRGRVEHDGRQVQVSVVYPDSFPYMRPQVYAPGLALERHFNPFDGNLCLLDRSSREWNTNDTGAWLIDTRLPQLLALLAEGGSALRQAEAPQGEPLTSFLASSTGAALFVPQEVLDVPEHLQTGTLQIALGMQPLVGALRGAVVSVESGKRRGEQRWRSAPVPERLSARFSLARITAPWVRLNELPATRDPAAFIEQAREISPESVAPRWLPAQGGQIAPLALLLPEEVRQGETEQTWMVVVRARPPAGVRAPSAAYLLRGERLSLEDLHVRIPALAGIEGDTISVAGLGTLGAPIAMELARTQLGGLRLLDPDALEVGNIVRWPFGLPAVGSPKSGFLAEQIGLQYPFTDALSFTLQIGEATDGAAEERESETLSAFLAGSDLLIEATGEVGVAQLLADLAADAGAPMLSVWGTEGGWGGAVAEIRPGSGGCWFCLQLAIDRGAIPAPPAEQAGLIQPRGCGAPTFTGASYDMLEIVAQAVRCARRILLEPPRPSTVHICWMRCEDGRELDAPAWQTFALERQPGCPCCAQS